MDTNTSIKNFLEIPYDELEKLNIQAKDKRDTQPNKRERVRFLPPTMVDAIRLFRPSEFIANSMGPSNKGKYLHFKQLVADRSPKELGTRVKNAEILYHHEVTNQELWNRF